jgi:hypothetical protein
VPKKSNTQEFIQKAINSDKVKKGYKYDKVKYKTAIIKVSIGCFNDEHGYFNIRPNNFLSGQGC